MKELFFLMLLIGMSGYASQAQEATTQTTTHKKVVKRSNHHRVVHKRTTHHTFTSTSKHGIKVVQDDPHNPYEGKPSRQNDGVKKNEQRNINYQTGQPLPPSNGSNMK